MKVNLAVMCTTQAVVKIRPEKNSGLYGKEFSQFYLSDWRQYRKTVGTQSRVTTTIQQRCHDHLMEVKIAVFKGKNFRTLATDRLMEGDPFIRCHSIQALS